MTHLSRAADGLPWRWMCIHAGCIIWIVFAPPLFTFALQPVLLSRPVCSQLHYPTAFGLSCTRLSSALKTWTLRLCPCKIIWSFSYRPCLVLFSSSCTDSYLLWQQWFTYDSSNSEHKLVFKISFPFSSDMTWQENDNILQGKIEKWW